MKQTLRLVLLTLLCGLFAAAVLSVVDLSPRVESDFFFANDDPQLQATTKIARLFPTSSQLLVRAGGDPREAAYLDSLRELTGTLQEIPGVTKVYSLTQGPGSPESARTSPLWKRLLLPAGGESASTLILELADGDSQPTVARLEAALAAADRPGFALSASGVPYVVELIRRHLLRDLRVFSLASLLLFGFTVALVYRSLPVVLGALVSCLTACVLTFLVLHLLKLQLGLLTANLATIVFVLTLSHVIFLSARWRSESGPEAVAVAVRETLPASFWCMVTTLLGFLSLLFASARPLRELGLAGAIGAAAAMAVAFLLYPRFLQGSRPQAPDNAQPRPQISFRGLAIGTVVLGLLVAFALPGLRRLNTDPSLLSYFQKGGDLARGLTLIDQDGGSSPLDLVVRAPDGAVLHSGVAYQRLQALQKSLEEDPAVGTALSLPVLLAEAQQVPFAAFLAPDQLLALLDSPAFGSLGRSFITEDRRQARIFLRMREGGRNGSRLQVVERLVDQVREAGLEPELVGGLYDLQGRLSRLVRSSVLVGLGGLAVLFTLISAYVSRRLRTTLVMLAGVVAVPILIFGTLGYLSLPLDVISSPAANVAVAVGIDSMIHMVLRRRRLRQDGLTAREAWNGARQQMAAPILAAALVIAAGFGIFILSSFPPTRHFGLAVVIGTLSAAALALIALPCLASRERDRLA